MQFNLKCQENERMVQEEDNTWEVMFFLNVEHFTWKLMSDFQMKIVIYNC